MICNTLQWLYNAAPDIGWLPVIAVVVYVLLLCWAAAYGSGESIALYVSIATVGLCLILFHVWASEYERTRYGCNVDPGMCGYSRRNSFFFYGCQSG